MERKEKLMQLISNAIASTKVELFTDVIDLGESSTSKGFDLYWERIKKENSAFRWLKNSTKWKHVYFVEKEGKKVYIDRDEYESMDKGGTMYPGLLDFQNDDQPSQFRVITAKLEDGCLIEANLGNDEPIFKETGCTINVKKKGEGWYALFTKSFWKDPFKERETLLLREESVTLRNWYCITFKKNGTTEIRVDITKEDYESLEIAFAKELEFRKTKEFAEKKIDENLEKYHVDLLEKYK